MVDDINLAIKQISESKVEAEDRDLISKDRFDHEYDDKASVLCDQKNVEASENAN